MSFNSFLSWLKTIFQADPSSTVFQGILNRTKVQVHGQTTFTRDMRDTPWSDGLHLYGKQAMPWYSAFIRCSDSDNNNYQGAKSEIIYSMFYSPINSDNDANGWGNVPEVAVDSCFAGSYEKDLVIDGNIVWTYTPGAPRGPWVMYNLETNQILVLHSQFD